MSPFAVLVVGLLLIYLEFYLPGAIMGTGGALLVIASIVLFSMSSESPLSILIFVTIAIVLTVAVIKFALWHIRRTKGKKTIFLESDQEGYVASTFDRDAVGQFGLAHTDLHPAGYVIVGGKKHDAVSISGYISKGTKIEVVSGEGECLQVRQSHAAD